jgi:hypothetical protein
MWGKAPMVPNQTFSIGDLTPSARAMVETHIWIWTQTRGIMYLPWSQFYHFHLLRILFMTSRKYSCSGEFYARLNPLMKHIEERENFSSDTLRSKLNACLQKCVWKLIGECRERSYLTADCPGRCWGKMIFGNWTAQTCTSYQHRFTPCCQSHLSLLAGCWHRILSFLHVITSLSKFPTFFQQHGSSLGEKYALHFWDFYDVTSHICSYHPLSDIDDHVSL